jgi:hypothetical protein
VTSSTPNVRCSLTPEELQKRRQDLIPGLLKRAKEVVDLQDGLRVRFANFPGLLSSLAAVIEQEQICCSFLQFRISIASHGGDVDVEVTGPPGTAEMLRDL